MNARFTKTNSRDIFLEMNAFNVSCLKLGIKFSASEYNLVTIKNYLPTKKRVFNELDSSELTSAVTFLRSSFMTDDTVLTYNGSTIPSITIDAELEGTLDATRNRDFNSAWGEVSISVHLAGQTQGGSARYTTSGTLTKSGLLSGIGGKVIDEKLFVNFTNVPANTPITFGLTLDALTSAVASGYNGTGKSLFGNTFNLNTTGDVFTSTDPLFTNANAPSINLIDNRYTIPEPSAATLLLVGGTALVRRRKA